MPADIDDPELQLSEIFRAWPEVIQVFLKRRMLCVGCPISTFHTVRDACREYALDEPEFRAELRRAITSGGNARRRY